jgi:flagellar biosynthesis regulator FlbT
MKQPPRILPEAYAFNHAFDFAFEVGSHDEAAKDVTGAMLRASLKQRLDTLSDKELLAACDCFDTMAADA